MTSQHQTQQVASGCIAKLLLTQGMFNRCVDEFVRIAAESVEVEFKDSGYIVTGSEAAVKRLVHAYRYSPDELKASGIDSATGTYFFRLEVPSFEGANTTRFNKTSGV